MTDLISKINWNIKNKSRESNDLISKYRNILKHSGQKKDIPYLAYIIEICSLHINGKYSDLSPDWKAWSVVVVTRLFTNNLLEEEADIYGNINAFILYYKTEYSKYSENVNKDVSDYDKENKFVNDFLQKKSVIK